MLQEINIKDLTSDSSILLNDYHDCIRAIICLNPSNDCYLGNCKKCPETDVLKEILIEAFDRNCIN